MPTTVYFATNRALTGPTEDWRSYGAGIVAPSDPTSITYATAFVDNTDLSAGTTGAIISIQDATHGSFSNSAIEDLSTPGRNLLIFIHGFDNSFENAITRAAFNREWLAQAGVPAADAGVVVFSWPSVGQRISFPLPWEDYKKDQTMARLSGFHLMAFFANLSPILLKARTTGARVFLLAHSMGSTVLGAAVESWFFHGIGDTFLFDEAFLAAADDRFDAFEFPEPGHLSSMHRLADRISIYFSRADEVLRATVSINLGAKRLGEDGPNNRSDTTRFPPTQYRLVDCTEFRDYALNFESSHQYYRRSPGVRGDIVNTMSASDPGIQPLEPWPKR